MRNLLKTLRALLFVLGGTSCGTVVGGGDAATSDGPTQCTAIGCQNGLYVSMQRTSTWSVGEHQFVVDVDGRSTTCSVTLPFSGCAGAPFTRCTVPDLVQIEESGCALPAASHALTGIRFNDRSPTRVSISYRSGGREVVSMQFMPRYQTVRPNGPLCEPVCMNAQEVFTIP